MLEVNRKWFQKNITQSAFLFWGQNSQNHVKYRQTIQRYILSLLCALEVTFKVIISSNWTFLSFGMKTFSTKSVVLQVLILSSM